MKARSPRKAPCINSVRILESLSNPIGITGPDGRPYRFVEPGSNHHIAIFEYTDDQGRKRRCKEIVTRFEAAQRVLRKESVIRRTHVEHPEAKFLMSLAINDMALVENNGEKVLCRVQTISAGSR